MKNLLSLLLIIAILSCDKFVRIQKVERIEIECDSIAPILQEVYTADQYVRNNDVPFKTLVHTDHDNLEKVVSILEQCGMPSLDEVNKKQLDAIWLVLQHAPDEEYIQKYLPDLEAAAKRGDLKWGVIATIKDRILLNQGKQQLYGTQIKEGKVYNLAEPEYVNQRRKEVGLEPIQIYLKHFNVKFDVPQKTK